MDVPPRRGRNGPPEERFHASYDPNGPIPEHAPDLGRCWIWTKGRMTTGLPYGRFADVGSKVVLAHRYSHELFIGPIPKGAQVDHLCRDVTCVNPKHLEAVTQPENLRRQQEAYNITHCPQGHEYTESNTRWRRNRDGIRTWRVCRTCARIKAREYKRTH